jgi:hypothetical protein
MQERSDLPFVVGMAPEFDLGLATVIAAWRNAASALSVNVGLFATVDMTLPSEGGRKREKKPIPWKTPVKRSTVRRCCSSRQPRMGIVGRGRGLAA